MSERSRPRRKGRGNKPEPAEQPAIATKKGPGRRKSGGGKKVDPPAKKGTKVKSPPGKKGRRDSKGGAKKGGPKGKDKKDAGKKKPEPRKSKTAEELDAEMNDYFMKDEKTALKHLDDEMDAYKAEAAKKRAEEEEKTAST